jgi:hypothetical protein
VRIALTHTANIVPRVKARPFAIILSLKYSRYSAKQALRAYCSGSSTIEPPCHHKIVKLSAARRFSIMKRAPAGRSTKFPTVALGDERRPTLSASAFGHGCRSRESQPPPKRCCRDHNLFSQSKVFNLTTPQRFIERIPANGQDIQRMQLIWGNARLS